MKRSKDNATTQAYEAYERMKHVVVKNVAKISSVMLQYVNSVNYLKLTFVPYQDFDRFLSNDSIYTYVERGAGEWLLKIKPNIAKQNVDLKICYNESLDFDLDSELYIPDAYVELLIVALTHKLALNYPRLDDAQMARLEADLASAQKNVMTPKAESKMVIRDRSKVNPDSYYGLLTGAHLYGF